MTTPQKTSIFLFFLLLLPISYSISLDELISSYDFSYSDNSIEINTINHYGSNLNGNSLYDDLIINININNEEGDYTFIAQLTKNQETISSINETSLSAGTNSLFFTFNPKLMQNTQYNLSLFVYSGGNLIYREYNIYPLDFNNLEYEKPDYSIGTIAHQFIDSNSNSKYDILRANLQLTSLKNSISKISASIECNDTIIIADTTQSISIGSNSVQLDFNTTKIRKSRADSCTLYKIEAKDVINYTFPQDYKIDFSLSDLDSNESFILGVTDEELFDLNNNSLIDYIRFTLQTEIKEPGDYLIEADVYDLFDEKISTISITNYLASGTKSSYLVINGSTIYAKKLDGPYTLDVRLKILNQTIDSLYEIYTTQEYSYGDFEKPPLPDITVNLEGSQALIKNIGEVPSFSFFVDITEEENTTSIYIPLLDVNDSYPINISHSVVTIFADSENLVEESNEDNNMLYSNSELNIFLYPGWNLISIPLNISNNSVDYVLKDITYNSIFTYDNKWLIPKEFNPDLGYWIQVNSTQSLALGGNNLTQFSFDYSKQLIGYPNQDNLNLTTYTFQRNTTIFSFDNELKQWKTFSTLKNTNSLNYLGPWKGYFIISNDSEDTNLYAKDYFPLKEGLQWNYSGSIDGTPQEITTYMQGTELVKGKLGINYYSVDTLKVMNNDKNITILKEYFSDGNYEIYSSPGAVLPEILNSGVHKAVSHYDGYQDDGTYIYDGNWSATSIFNGIGTLSTPLGQIQAAKIFLNTSWYGSPSSYGGEYGYSWLAKGIGVVKKDYIIWAVDGPSSFSNHIEFTITSFNGEY